MRLFRFSNTTDVAIRNSAGIIWIPGYPQVNYHADLGPQDAKFYYMKLPSESISVECVSCCSMFIFSIIAILVCWRVIHITTHPFPTARNRIVITLFLVELVTSPGIMKRAGSSSDRVKVNWMF